MAFTGRILVIGLGSVSRCLLPMMFEQLPAAPAQYTVIDFADVADDARRVVERGASFVAAKVTNDNYAQLLGRYVGRGDLIVDLAWNIGTADMLDWCRQQGVLYVNASLEVWDPYGAAASTPPTERTLYARHMALRDMIARWGDNRGPTAVIDHGANPGLVSHFVKAGLADIADRWLEPNGAPPGPARQVVAAARAAGDWAELSRSLGVTVIHISERDTQISTAPKCENEFVNTWSVEGFFEEGTAPAEMGWGTHEKSLPPGAHVHERGPGNQICLSHPGCRTWVRSWVPMGSIVGMVIRHGEAFSISEALTVWRDGVAEYRPTVHYAYCPCDAAIASLHELHMRNDVLQPAQRIMNDDIISGRDELGCLLMGHPFTSWWIGSRLDIHEARTLVPHQNATTLQVAAGLLGAVEWMLDNRAEGVRLPDDLPYDRILASARPYLGPFLSVPTDWTPLQDWDGLFGDYGRPKPGESDRWQFSSFLVRGP